VVKFRQIDGIPEFSAREDLEISGFLKGVRNLRCESAREGNVAASEEGKRYSIRKGGITYGSTGKPDTGTWATIQNRVRWKMGGGDAVVK
jgi:hypothetical protein